MKEYPDPKRFLEQHMEQSAQKHVKWMAEQGMTPTPTLLNAIGNIL